MEGSGWRVSWCVGHLAGLADADSYDPKYAKWRYDDLPILPEHWQMVVGKDKKKQFDILKKLMNAPDVTEVVNACDAGREGELIFRSVYELAGCQKPMKRLWISSMEDSAIREGFANLRLGADYDGLRDAALCRAKADWLVGINATRLFSVLYHRTLNIGRVMSPTLALIVQREAEIDTFKPVPFYTVALELPGLTVSGERMADKAAAEQLKEACQGAAVTDVYKRQKLLKNPNGLILGTPGSGKSFSAKREIANCFLLTSDDVIICDPEAEYAPLVERLHGQVIKISPTSTNYINPMDLNLDYSDDESPLSLKSDFILSLCELIVGGKEGLQPVQKTIIDRCVRLVYQTYLNDPRPENMPILEDLYNLLREQEEKEAQYIATALEIYVTGSLNVFNHQSNVDINNRIVCYDIKELGKQLKKIGMLVVQDQVWNRVTINRAAHKSTRYYIDEMHLLLKEEQTAAYTVEIWKRFRKWGGIPTGDWVCNLLAA